MNNENEGEYITCVIEKVIMDDEGVHMIVENEGKRVIVTGKDYEKGDYFEGNFVDIKIKYIDNIPGEWKFEKCKLPLWAAKKIKVRKPYMEIRRIDMDRLKISFLGIEDTIPISDIDEFASNFVHKFAKDQDILEEFEILIYNFRLVFPLWNFIDGWKFGMMEKPSKELRHELIENYSKED
jgi:hypothetical protein